MEDTIELWFKKGYTNFDSSEGLNRDHPFELKRLNVIVGANNSGKSRFMRELAIQCYKNEIEVRPSYSRFDAIRNILVKFNKSSNILKWNELTGFETMLSNFDPIIKDIFSISNFVQGFSMAGSHDYESYKHVDFDKEKIIAASSDFIDDPSVVYKIYQNMDITKFNIFYISNLRSLKKLPKNSKLDETSSSGITSIAEKIKNSARNHPTRNTDQVKEVLISNPLLQRAYQDYDFIDHQIISGEEFFDLLTDSLLGKPNERQRIQDYQEKLSHYFFNNESITIIPYLKTDTIEIKIGDEEQFPISRLGDGLQQIIILTYRAFLTTEPSFFFIEEPEMHLHAGYVKQLMKFLLNETNHYYMATSHSNYLLDMINEDKRIALYRVDKKQMDDGEERYETVIKRCDNDRTILRTLGVSPSSVFLANCTIWVEGITDRLYFVQYLKKYLEELKTSNEDKWQDYSRFIDGYHYAFVEYQGSNLDHWDFAIDCPNDVDSNIDKGLPALLTTSHALVVADADLRDKPRFTELQSQLNDNMVVTQGKETENTLPAHLLRKKFFSMCPHSGLSNKGNQSKLAYNDEYDKYFDDSYESSNLGIGEYLDNILEAMRSDGIVPVVAEEETSFTFSEGGQKTIKNKSNFCRDVITLMENEDWNLTDSAKQICEKIFEHIKRNND